MQKMLEIILVGAVLSIIQQSTLAWEQEIHVSQSAGIHNESCWSGGYFIPCADLNLALRGAIRHNNSIAIIIQPGNYSLLDGSETKLMHKQQMGMIGNSTLTSEVTIHCSSPAGLHFMASQELVFDSLVFKNCGVYDNQTATVLYFESCEGVKITSSSFMNSIGVAAFFNDTFGTVTITGSLFIGSTCNTFQFECGGIVIRMASNPSDDAISTNAYYVVNNTAFIGNDLSVSSPSFMISFCSMFGTYSYAGMGAGVSILLKGNTRRNHVQLLNNTFSGNSANFGGGLLIALCDNATENSISVEQSQFVTNSATGNHTSYQRSGDGGGALVAIENMNGDMNSVLFRGCHFSNNSASHGGGLAVITFSQSKEPRTHLASNILNISNCDFQNNNALLGLALYFYQGSFSNGGGINVILSKVVMHKNIPLDSSAPSGGVLYSYDSSITLSEFVSFSENDDTTLLALDSSLLVSTKARVLFEGNTVLDGRVIVLECSKIIVSADSVMTFELNKNISVVLYSSCGSNKAEVYSDCFLQYENNNIHPDDWKTQFIFRNNTGCSPNEDNWSCSNLESSIPTMIYDTNILSCAWPAKESKFVSKSDFSQIFMWPPFNYSEEHTNNTIMSGPVKLTIQDVLNITLGERIVFPITVYDYIGNNITGNLTFHVCIVGGNYYLAEGVTDDQSSCIYTKLNQTLTMFSTKSATMEIDSNIGFQVVYLDFATAGTSELTIRLTTNLYQRQQPFLALINEYDNCDWTVCSNGSNGYAFFSLFDSEDTCYSEKNSEDSKSNDCNHGSVCSDQSYFFMPYGKCFWTDSNIQESKFGNCPPVYTQESCYSASIFYPNTINNESISDNCMKDRTGLLCGQCKNNLCIAINSIHLACAAYEHYNWILFIALQILPLTLFLLLLMFFGISLNYHSTNAYIFFAQMVTLRFPGRLYPTWTMVPYWSWWWLFPPVVAALYSFWSLDFSLAFSLEPFCIISGMTAVQAIAFQYFTAAYPLLVVAITCAWIEMYARGVRFVFCITRPVQHLLARCSQKLKIERSLTETFAVMFTLSFTQLARVSVQLLSFTTVTIISNTTDTSALYQVVFYYDASLGYFSEGHAPYAILALIVLSLFVVAPTVFLLLIPLKTFRKFLSLLRLNGPALQSIVDAFMGCFKDRSSKHNSDRGFFAGFFLILRIFFVALYTIPDGSEVSVYKIIYSTEGAIGLAVAGLIMLYRPYKCTSSNVLDFLMFIYLGLLALLCAFSFSDDPYYTVITLIAWGGPIYLPAFLLACWLVYLITKRIVCDMCRRKRNVATTSLQQYQDEDSEGMKYILADAEDDSFPDRLRNPEDYCESHT